MQYETSFTVFPQDVNYNSPPCIFGGKMLAEMDNAAAMACRRVLYGTECTDCVTVKAGADFSRPAYVGDIVRILADVCESGTKSLSVSVKAWREDKSTGSIAEMASGTFVFVSRKNGVPHPHGHYHSSRRSEHHSQYVIPRGDRPFPLVEE